MACEFKKGERVLYVFQSGEKTEVEIIDNPSWGWDMFDGRTWTMSVRFEDGQVIRSIADWQLRKKGGQNG